MNEYLYKILIGAAAGAIDIIPMIIKREKLSSTISAFIHWLVAGFIIGSLQMDIQPWAKGLIFGELLAVPMIIVVGAKDKTAIIPMIIMSGILGLIVAIVS